MMPEQEQQEKKNISEAEQSAAPQAAVAEPAAESGPGLDPSKAHHENIYDILMDQDEITWQSIIKELIKTEQMDPWDINISLLTKMFIKTLKKLKEMNLHVSGKVLLAAALLLRIKSGRLVGDDLLEFDRLLASGERDELYETEEGYVEGQLNQMGMTLGKDQMKLVPKTPQPRSRKVSVYMISSTHLLSRSM
jgi:chromatin segregation and condensation protein Rec8/ScpA/Scc1 (kleisin family)